LERIESDRQNNIEQHKEIRKELSLLEDKITGVEKEIIKFKVHLFYFILILKVIIDPLIERATQVLFP